MHNKATLM